MASNELCKHEARGDQCRSLDYVLRKRRLALYSRFDSKQLQCTLTVKGEVSFLKYLESVCTHTYRLCTFPLREVSTQYIIRTATSCAVLEYLYTSVLSYPQVVRRTSIVPIFILYLYVPRKYCKVSKIAVIFFTIDRKIKHECLRRM